MISGGEAVTRGGGESAVLDEVELVDATFPASPKERIKQQIIRSIDYVTSVGASGLIYLLT